MLMVRRAYGCDCDGASHLGAVIEWTPEQQGMRAAVRAWLGAIESLVGVRPQTCPWRALYHPLVLEVRDVVALAAHGVGMARLGEDPPAILVDAISAYERARSAALAHNLERRRAEEERKRGQ